MKAIAPDTKTSWTLRMTDEEYGHLSQPALAHLKQLAVGKPRNGRSGWANWEFWGHIHLQLAIEVCLYEGLTLES